MTRRYVDDQKMLDELQWETFEYFLEKTNKANGLVADRTEENWPASIAATGLALAAYPVGVERGFITREAAAGITPRHEHWAARLAL
jgi:hypothetical protein